MPQVHAQARTRTRMHAHMHACHWPMRRAVNAFSKDIPTGHEKGWQAERRGRHQALFALRRAQRCEERLELSQGHTQHAAPTAFRSLWNPSQECRPHGRQPRLTPAPHSEMTEGSQPWLCPPGHCLQSRGTNRHSLQEEREPLPPAPTPHPGGRGLGGTMLELVQPPLCSNLGTRGSKPGPESP